MREIVSPLSGIRSPFGQLTSPLAIYAVLGIKPDLVFDFDADKYFVNSRRSTFSDSITHTRAGNATMVDSDGVLKWGAHNLLTYSEDATQWTSTGGSATGTGLTDPEGGSGAVEWTFTGINQQLYNRNTFPSADYIAKCWIKGVSGETISFSGSGLLTLTGEWQLASVVLLSGTTPQVNFNTFGGATARVIQVWGAHLHRSDLGGMVDNPDRGDSYVPTTSSAVYLPRRGHHVYNGSAWVNEGLLHESEARTQLLHTTNALVTQSHTVTAVPHTLHFTGTGTVTLSGASTAGPLVGTGTGEQNRVSLTFTPSATSLTLTVSGTVTDAQLEVGSTPSSYIPNLAGSGTATRAAETLTVPAANMPWPEPVYIGDELVTNGTFDTDTSGWNISNADLAAVSGELQISNQSSSPVSAAQSISLTVGKVYAVEVTSRLGDSGGTVARASFFGNIFASANSAAPVTETIHIVASSSSATLSLFSYGTSSTEAYFDNISVREIDPL
ncbi:MAG: hypothetical protein GY892_19230, partial [Shimia sp.]|nr:hypothetical protein [Shimia sp.]